MLRQAVTHEEWLRLGSAWGAHLAPLLPELAAIWPDLPPARPLDMRAARGLLFEALLQLVRLLARTRPVLFFLDDAHWSDEATLAALAFLEEREIFARRGLLLFAARGEHRSRALEDFLARSPARPRLDIGLLTPGEVTEMARYALGQTPPPDLAAQLAGGTGGNPLFLLETLRAWLDVSAVPLLSAPFEPPPVAASMQALLRERVRGFTPRKRAVLTTAAVIGHEFTPAVLEAACSLDPEPLVAVLEDLERDHLIAPAAGPATESYVFIHDQLRELLVLDLSPARRRMLHMRVAAALEEVLGARTPQQTAALAAHREAAGQNLDAYHLWLRTAANARRLFSPGDADTAYRRAAQLLPRILSRLDDAGVAALYGEWGELAYDLNDPGGQEQAYAAMLAIGEERRSAHLVGSALSGLASVDGLRGRPEQALHAVTLALPYLEQSGDLYERILARIRRGRFLMCLNRHDDALQSLREAVALDPPALDLRARRAAARALTNLSLVYSLTGWPRLALQTGETALAESRLLLFPSSQARTRSVLALSCYFLGRYDDALEHCRDGLELSASASLKQSGLLQVVNARCLLWLGRLDEAWQHSLQALERGRASTLPEVVAGALCMQGDLFYLIEDYRHAVTLYQDGLDAGEAGSFATLELEVRLGLALADVGQVAAGRQRLETALARAEGSGMGSVYVPAAVQLAAVEIYAGDLPAAEKRLPAVRAAAAARDMPAILLACDLLETRLHLQNGRAAEALRLAESASARACALRNPNIDLLACQERPPPCAPSARP